MWRKLALATGLAVGCCLTAWADKVRDPEMGIEAGSLSDPIAIGTTLIPINGGGTFDFFNPFDGVITELTFQVFIRPGLRQELVEDAFHCQKDNPFFLGCFVNYEPKTGVLTIGFTGTRPQDDDPKDDEVGEHEGIPPLLPGCINHPNVEHCDDVGHFLVTLNEDFEDEGADGGWSKDRNPKLFESPQIFITVTGIVAGEEEEKARTLVPAQTLAQAPTDAPEPHRSRHRSY